jgi:hypothetical protein
MDIAVDQSQVMLVLLAAGLLVWLAAVLWIVVAAFRTSLVWGVLLVVLTPLYLIYALLEWSRPGVRYAFLVSVLGLLMAGAGWYGGAGRVVLAELDRLGDVVDPALRSQVEQAARRIPTAVPPDEPLPNEAQVPDDPEILAVDPLDEAYQIPPAQPLPPVPENAVEPPPARGFTWRRVGPGLLRGYLGSRVRIELRDGRRVEGLLMPGADESIMVEVQQGTGRIGYEYLLSQIRSAEVFVPVTPEARTP